MRVSSVFIRLSKTGLRQGAVHKRSRALFRECCRWFIYVFFKFVYLEEVERSCNVGDVRKLGVVGRILLKFFLKNVGRV
jgi:hypothetical protein